MIEDQDDKAKIVEAVRKSRKTPTVRDSSMKKRNSKRSRVNLLGRFGDTKQPMGLTRICSIQSELMRILHTPDKCLEFEAFLDNCLARENLDFYRSVEQFKNLEAQGKVSEDDAVAAAADKIVSRYISKSGAQSVTLTGRARDKVVARAKSRELSFTMFDSAQREAFDLLKLSSVRDFLLEKIRKGSLSMMPPTKKRNTMDGGKKVSTKLPAEDINLTEIFTPDPLFEDVIKKMGDKQAIEEFRSFLKKEYASENIDFLLEVFHFRKKELNRREIEVQARQIFLTYLQAGADRELTVSASISTHIRSYFELGEDRPPITQAVFDEAFSCTTHVLEHDSLPRFLIAAQAAQQASSG